MINFLGLTTSYSSFQALDEEELQKELASKQEVKTNSVMVNQETKTVTTPKELGGFSALAQETKKTGAKEVSVFQNKTENKIGDKVELNKKTQTAQKAKKGTGLDQALTNFYGEKYTNASDEEKEKMIVKYFDWLSKDKKGVISQLDQFKLYRDRCTDKEEYRRLSSVIDKMEAKYQTNAATTVMTKGTKEQREIGTEEVSKDIHHYDKNVQLGVTKVLVKTGNSKAIITAASHASELDKENQAGAVDLYGTAKISKEAKNKLGKTIIDQYEKFHKDNQLKIHTSMSDKKHWESKTIEYAGSNISKLDKENQTKAVQITIKTGNEAAIKAAAETKANIEKQNAEKAAQVKAEQEAQAQKQCKTQVSENTYSERLNKVTNILNSDEVGSFEKLTEEIGQLTDTQKIDLLEHAASTSSLSSVINAVLATNPSLKVLDRIEYLIKNSNMNENDKKTLVEAYAKTFTSEKDAAESCLADTQTFLKMAAQKGTLNLIKEDKLSHFSKLIYKELKKEQSNNIG